MKKWFRPKRHYHSRPNGEIWLEISLWEEFKSAFKNKNKWRYVIRKVDKYLSYHGERTMIDDLTAWEDRMYTATLFKTYGEAARVNDRLREFDNKKIDIILLRPL